MRKEIIYLALSFLIFVVLKFLYSYTDAETLRFLLAPVSWGVELFTGEASVFKAAYGYFYPNLNMIIDKSCSGYTFGLICFLMTSFVLIRSERIPKLITIPLAILFSYIVTIVANVSRIIIYLMFMKADIGSSFNISSNVLHESEGVFVYLFFLIAFYFALNYILNNKSKNEKIA